MIYYTVAVSFILSVLQISFTNGQGEQCYSPNNQYGICVVLPQCPYLVQIYGQNPRNQQVINYLIGSQRNCGTRSISNNPLVCCNNPVSNTQPTPATRAPPTQGFPTLPPSRPPPPTFTDPIPVTQAPTTPRPAPLTDRSCQDPNGLQGECISIRECPAILTEFVARQKDQAYVQYIQNSNAICKKVQPHICCPTSESGRDGSTVAPPAPATRSPSNDLKGRLLSVEEGCGYSNVTHTRIVGGEPAKLGAWPWMALIGYTNNLGVLSWKCGGSLITTRHVLTAAHCIKNTLTTVRLGEHDTSIETETNSIDIPVVKVAKYEKYDSKDGNSDLAILYLERDVDITLLIRPICIPKDEPIRTKSFTGYQPFVAGWGRTQEGGQSSNILQELQVPVLDNAVCKDRYKKQGKLISEKQFNEAILCAGVLSGGQDSCQGDSGGPLMAPSLHEGQAVFHQIGIVSYGIGCARTDVPGVYSRVQTFVDWIQQKVSEPV